MQDFPHDFDEDEDETPIGLPWWYPIIATILILSLVLSMIGPLLVNRATATPQQCDYHILVMAFDDVNGNRVQDNDENPLPGVAVSVYLPGQHPVLSLTDENGQVEVARYAQRCARGLSSRVTVEIAPPVGYIITTPLSEAHFPVTIHPTEPPLQALSVGLQRRFGREAS